MHAQNHCHHYEAVYEEAEIKANKFNLLFLCALFIIGLIIVLLTIIGVFSAPLSIIIPVFIIALALFTVPLFTYLIHDKILRKETSILTKKYFKYVIFIPCYLAILIFIVMLTFHAVLLAVIPPLMAAQYRFVKRDWIIIFVVTIIIVPLSIYGSYIFGLADRNLLKGIAEEDLDNIDARLEMLKSGRALTLFLHHILPRALVLTAVNLLIAIFVQRHNAMLDNQAMLAHEVEEEAEKRNQLQTAVIDELASVIETRDVGTGEHVRRTKTYVRILATHLAEKDKYKDILTPETINKFVSAAALHDIGKIAVSDTILLKPGRLTSEEFEKMKIHTTKGGELVKTFFTHFTEDTFFNEAYDIAMYHHEKWDGSGYPTGLSKEEIPLAARIMAIADVYDALVSKRVYKDAYNPDEAFDIMFKEAGHHFDPELIEVLKEVKDEFIAASMN